MIFPIKVNQVWEPREGNIIRRLRILAPHPDGGYIVYDEVSKMHSDRLSICPEFNLRQVFKCTVNVCDHRHVRDGFSDREYPSSIPDLHVCEDCGDTFPQIGDTALWFPKQLELVAGS